jgi:hypothetical protein
MCSHSFREHPVKEEIVVTYQLTRLQMKVIT